MWHWCTSDILTWIGNGILPVYGWLQQLWHPQILTCIAMSVDGHGWSGYCDIHGYCDRGVCTVVSVHGWSWMVMATVTSMDTVTVGYAQWCPSMDGHGWSRQLWRPWILWWRGMYSGVRPWIVMDGHGSGGISRDTMNGHGTYLGWPLHHVL